MLKETIKNSPVVVKKGRYAYLKGDETEIKEHFLVSKDKDETTIVTEEANVDSTQHAEITKWFKLFEIKVATPFIAPGFLAAICNAVSKKHINLLIVSTYSKDYVLIPEKDCDLAMDELRKVGFSVEVE